MPGQPPGVGGGNVSNSDQSPEETNRQHPNQRELITVAIKYEVIVCYSSLGKEIQILKISIQNNEDFLVRLKGFFPLSTIINTNINKDMNISVCVGCM